MGVVASELTWIGYLLDDLHIPPSAPIPFYCDNKATLHIVENPVFHERTKHFEIDCHLIRDKFKDGLLLPSFVSSRQQLEDLFIKALPVPQFSALLSKLGLVVLHPRPAWGGDNKMIITSAPVGGNQLPSVI
ncbi:UNVERIFIED_CONTAM: hypothetical protein Sangu_0998500 [Sesamum angustifolium]|uniref:Copia protein n=1 Tax=Sesamum angustifolium TaxID=2727405 RepID=A0AAW2PE46_9LAMI